MIETRVLSVKGKMIYFDIMVKVFGIFLAIVKKIIRINGDMVRPRRKHPLVMLSVR